MDDATSISDSRGEILSYISGELGGEEVDGDEEFIFFWLKEIYLSKHSFLFLLSKANKFTDLLFLSASIHLHMHTPLFRSMRGREYRRAVDARPGEKRVSPSPSAPSRHPVANIHTSPHHPLHGQEKGGEKKSRLSL
jgi:hypothetical protein